MVDQPNVNPNSSSQPPAVGDPAASQKTKPKSEFKDPQPESKSSWAKPMHWLGMDFTAEQSKQLWNIITQNVSTQIKKEQDRAVKAIRKLNPDNPESDDS
jgi:hypothetical protein